MMRIDWLPEADRSLGRQLSYIADSNPSAAQRIASAIQLAISRLTEFPKIGRVGRVPGTRELIVAATPFVVVYRVETEAVLILRVLHGAQKWPPE